MSTLRGTAQSPHAPLDGAGDPIISAPGIPQGLDHPPQTYGSYLRVPDLLALQSLVSDPRRHDEMLFIIVQQVQELWFKQILVEVDYVIGLIGGGDLMEATRLTRRANLIMDLLAREAGILETMHPADFLHFRGILSTASGFESEQFRELEFASGLREPPFLNVMDKHMDPKTVGAIRERWPVSVREAFLATLTEIDDDPTEALVQVYAEPERHPHHFMLAEALSEYELLFQSWRFAHVKLVERTIGSRTTGTAGSAGHGYLARTLQYRFFPELWEARNRLSERYA